MRRRKRKIGSAPDYQLGRACVYLRISNPADTREASLDTQLQRIIERLRELGYEVGPEDVFRDKFTGKETIRRPGLNAMREAIREGKYRAVGCYKLDRLSRNMGQTFVLLAEMDELQVRPISVMETDIDNSPTGKLYRMMGAYMGEMELANLEDRFGRGREHIRGRGLPLGQGQRPYGMIFDKRTRTYSLDEDGPEHEGLIKWVRVMYEKSAAGESNHAIAAHLNALKVPPPGLAAGRKYQKRGHSGLWSPAAVGKILANPAYKGWTVEGKWYSEGVTDAGHSILRPIPEDEWVIYDRDGVITPRVVSDAVWAASRESRHRNALNKGSCGRKVHEYVLRGMIECRRCGGKMYGFTDDKGRKRYRCANTKAVEDRPRPDAIICDAPRVVAPWIEGLAWAALRVLLVTPGELEAAILRMLAQARDDGDAEDLRLAEANLAQQEKVRDRIYKKWREEQARNEPDEDMAAKWEADCRAMKGPIDSLKRTVETLRRRAESASSPEKVAAMAAEKFAALRERLLLGDDLGDDEKREALLIARTRVVVESNGRKRSHAGGTGEITFDLFDEPYQPETSPERCFQKVLLLKYSITQGLAGV